MDLIVIFIITADWFGETEESRDAYLAEAVEARQRALERAIALDPDNIETVLAQASEDFIAAQENLEDDVKRRKFIDHALELDPQNAWAWHELGYYLLKHESETAAKPAFLRALELDPLHARVVEAAHRFFRSAGDKEMTAQLAERLTQIAPELGKDKSLAKIPSSTKLNNLITLFLETADESVIETYAETYAAETTNIVTDRLFADPGLGWYEAHLLQLRNDLDGLLNFEIDALPEAPNEGQIANFVWQNELVLTAQRVSGRSSDAAATARRMLAALEELEWDPAVSRFSLWNLATFVAHVTLGDQDRMREMRQILDNDDKFPAKNQWAWTYVVLAYLDPDRAVERLLTQKAQHPSWLGTDAIAMHHIGTRHLIIHPDMQAFYAEEGKWIDYLAARVPEYAK